MMKKQHYMTHDERQQLEALSRAKIPVAQIARQLGFSRQTIYNELKIGAYYHTQDFNDEIRYSAQKANQKHKYAQTAKGRPLKIGNDHEFATYIENKIVKDKFSPAAALACAKKQFKTTVCTTTLYNYIDKGIFLQLSNKNLWIKARPTKHKKKNIKRIAHPQLPSISNRPEIINQRMEPGHWEMDLIISAKEKKTALLTLTERMTRKEIIIKIPNRKARTICKAIDKLEKTTTNFQEKFRSITTDNGPEFLNYEGLRKSIHGGTRFEVYYCHSYATR